MCGFLQFEMSESAWADAGRGAETGRRGRRARGGGWTAASDDLPYTMRARSCVSPGISEEYHAGGRPERLSRRPRRASPAGRRHVTPRPDRSPPRLAGRPADIARASSASSDAGQRPRRRRRRADHTSNSGRSGDRMPSTSLSFIAPKTSVDPAGSTRGLTEVGRQGACAGRVVRRVEQHVGALPRQAFQPRGPRTIVSPATIASPGISRPAAGSSSNRHMTTAALAA